MRKMGVIALSLFACALSVGWLLGPSAATAAGPVEASWNMERVGIAYNGDTIDLGPYSKLAPWPHTDGRYMYSPCYDPAPLVANVPGADRCFMTIDLKDHDKPVRLATVYAYDLVESPSPPAGHVVWTAAYPFPNLPVQVPCKVDWNDSEIKTGKTKPACWDPGWNTHTHYAQEGPGKILAVNQERYRGGTNRQANYHGVKFYDISDPANPVFLSYWAAPVSDPNPTTGVWPDAGGTHHFNWDNRYLYLGTEYKGYVGKILVILDVKNPRNPKEVATWHIPGQKLGPPPVGEDDVRNWTQQGSFSNPVVNIGTTEKPNWTKHVGMHYVSVHNNSAYISYHQAGLVILDVTQPSNPKFLSRFDYLIPGADPTNPDIQACKTAAGGKDAACGNTHATKRVPGRNLLMVSDEYFSCPYGHVRIFDISDETKPELLSHFLTDQNMNCNGSAPADPTRFPRRGPSSHLGNAWGSDLYFMAWYGMGVRAIDIADPYHPVEVGFYEYRIDSDLGAVNPTYAGSDTYDVIFGPGNYLYVSDGTSGMRVLKYTGRGAKD